MPWRPRAPACNRERMPRSRRRDEAVALFTPRFDSCATATAGHDTSDGRNARRRGQASFRPVLREIAEYPNSFGPLGPKDERIETDRYTLCMGSGKAWDTAQRQRFRRCSGSATAVDSSSMASIAFRHQAWRDFQHALVHLAHPCDVVRP